MSDSFVVDQTLVIHAERETVFSFFVDPSRFARWWGEGSSIEGKVGGGVRICYPNGQTASGEVVELEAPNRIVFTFGYDTPGKPIPPGGSRVEVTLTEVTRGTELRLQHTVNDESTRDAHLPGWRYHLAVFANVAADTQHEKAAAFVDRYFALWGLNDAETRRHELDQLITPDFEFRDRFGCTSGADHFEQHVAAIQAHFAGVSPRRDGPLSQAHGNAVCRWEAVAEKGEVVGKGINVFELSPTGEIARVIGMWDAPEQRPG